MLGSRITFVLIGFSSPILGRFLSSFIHRGNVRYFGRLRVVAWWFYQRLDLLLQRGRIWWSNYSFCERWFLNSSTRELLKWSQVRHYLSSKHQSPKDYYIFEHTTVISGYTQTNFHTKWNWVSLEPYTLVWPLKIVLSY